MKRLLVGALALSLLGGTGIASAQFYGYDRNQRYDRYHDRGYHRGWRQGDYVTQAEYRRWEYINWRRHHLYRPNRGYEWRRYGDNYFLVGINDGRISAVVRIR